MIRLSSLVLVDVCFLLNRLFPELVELVAVLLNLLLVDGRPEYEEFVSIIRIAQMKFFVFLIIKTNYF